ncbi:MAG TPA: hypothetical protein HA271_00870 [Methanobacterium subterraneum]|jgi:hypothetical protein|uniref:Uncharacterized protein n=1 Tax=Methanobacterium subterraneum TaxID=59277 RepID=A0A7J4TIR6_9EURY|nr:hypothetical protein [Methanobacterium subterraneum]
MICLNDDEKDILWNALAIAQDYYEKNGQKGKMKMAGTLLTISTMVEKVNFELYKDGITDEGRQILQEFMQNREKEREKGNVIRFPKGKNDRDSANPSSG